MSAQKGNLFLLGVGSGSGSSVTYTNVTSARSVDWTLNNSQVDVTTITSAGWKALLQGAGIQSMAITLSGAWEDAAVEQAVVTAATGNTFLNLKFTNGNGDEFVGSFAVSSYKRAGTYNGEETYNASFDSNGAVTYTPGG
jgi:TP901-1 family phage major tail protein